MTGYDSKLLICTLGLSSWVHTGSRKSWISNKSNKSVIRTGNCISLPFNCFTRTFESPDVHPEGCKKKTGQPIALSTWGYQWLAKCITLSHFTFRRLRANKRIQEIEEAKRKTTELAGKTKRPYIPKNSSHKGSDRQNSVMIKNLSSIDCSYRCSIAKATLNKSGIFIHFALKQGGRYIRCKGRIAPIALFLAYSVYSHSLLTTLAVKHIFSLRDNKGSFPWLNGALISRQNF